MDDEDVQSDSNGSESTLLPEGSDADALLAALISVIRNLPQGGPTDPPSSISVTVVVGGQLWTGQLISAKSWAITLARHVRHRSNVPELGEVFATLFDKFEELNETMLREAPIGFVHLLDAYPVILAGPSVTGGMPIRFRLSDVQGWTMGSPQVT